MVSAARSASSALHSRCPHPRVSSPQNHAPLTQPSASVGKKVSLVALGCPKNVVDGEVLLGDLSRAGFTVTDDHEDSDAIIVNT